VALVNPVVAPPSAAMQVLAAEATELHTRLLRFTLGAEVCRDYWEHCDQSLAGSDQALTAFEGRWFGSRSLPRVRSLLATLKSRFDPFPEALATLQRWRSMDATVRQLLCHFHLQLSDPIYRRFTSVFLLARRDLPDASVDRNAALRWIKQEFPERWSETTSIQFATKLLAASSEAGLVTAMRDPRRLLFPKASYNVLTYILYVLRITTFQGTLTDNPYFASLSLCDGLLDQRLRALPAITYRHMAHLTELDWEYPHLRLGLRQRYERTAVLSERSP
jgi:hypothetical protein